MKWSIRKGKFPYGNKDGEKHLFEELDLKSKDGEDDLKKELEKLGYEEWITYPIESKTPYTVDEQVAIDLYTEKAVHSPILIKSEMSKRKYEIFCGGFLFYHDKVFKKYQKGKGFYINEAGDPAWKTYPDDKFEHMIYFEWVNDHGTKADKVTIYITETPEEFNGNPPPPSPPPPPES